jgi:hypothetical protein
MFCPPVAGLGEPVLEPPRPVLVHLATQHAVVDECLQPVRQYVPRDRQTRGELFETAPDLDTSHPADDARGCAGISLET